MKRSGGLTVGATVRDPRGMSFSTRIVRRARGVRFLTMILAAAVVVGCRSTPNAASDGALGGQVEAGPPPDHIAQPVGPPPEVLPWTGDLTPRAVLRVDADAAAGFHWPYFLVLPDKLDPARPLFVEPNNDGRAGAPYETHLYWATIRAEQAYVDWGRHLEVAVLVPCFPRPHTADGRSNIYVHALSRAAIAHPDPALGRADRQLLAMVDDARRRIAGASESGEGPPARFMLWGFSAAADFVTRMAAIHPERVVAVAAGGIGGLPILPLSELEGTRLTYPVGVADLADLTGRPFDAEAYRRVPVLLLQGGADENDSVPEGDLDRATYVSDSYDFEQATFVNATFGASTVGRVPAIRDVHAAFGMESFTFSIVKGVEHTTTKAMEQTVRDFLSAMIKAELGGSATGR